MKSKLDVDVYFDLICPWCLIGKRNLERAVSQLRQEYPALQVVLRWHSVQLLADLPQEGVDFVSFYLKRLGTPEAARMRQAQVQDAARRAGVHIHFAAMARMPNTQQAHQLLAFAAARSDPACVARLMEDLFKVHFEDGGDLNDAALLQSMALRHGLDGQAWSEWLRAGRGQPQALSLTGVPFFVFNRLHALSGAQAPEVLHQAMCTALGRPEVATCPA